MNHTMNTLRLLTPRVLLLAALVGLAGCFSLGRDEPVRQHFVLGGRDIPDAVASDARLAGIRIGIRQLKMAEYLDRPLMVVRLGSNEIYYSEFNRWGGSLSSGVKRAVVGYMTTIAPFGGVDIAPWDLREKHDYLIQIHLLRMEGVVPENNAGLYGEAQLHALWEVISPEEGTVLVRGETDFAADGWQIDDYGGLADRLDSGLWQLSRDLVSAIAELESRD